MRKNKYERVLFYVINTWYGSKCYDKDEISRIVRETIRENPELGIVDTGVKAKRRCMNELQ